MAPKQSMLDQSQTLQVLALLALPTSSTISDLETMPKKSYIWVQECIRVFTKELSVVQVCSSSLNSTEPEVLHLYLQLLSLLLTCGSGVEATTSKLIKLSLMNFQTKQTRTVALSQCSHQLLGQRQ